MNENKKWYFFVLFFLVIEYARPQDIIHIGFLRPAMIVIGILTGFLLINGGLAKTKTKQINLIWLFIALTAALIPFARNNFYAWKTTEVMLLYMPFILSTIICVDSINRLKKMIFVCVCIMIYISIYSITHHGRGSGNYFVDENDLSLFINMWIPFCFYLFIYEKNMFPKLVYLAGMVVGVLSIVASHSRGGFVGLICMSFVVWIFSQKKIKSLLIIVVLAGIMFVSSDNAYWTRMSTTTDTNEGTAAARIESWKSAWSMFLDNPLGVGGNNFQVRFPQYQTSFFKRGMWGRVAHSLWFTLLSELGIIGVIIFFSLLHYNFKDIFYLRRITKNADNDLRYIYFFSTSCVASFAGYFASGTFISVLYYPHYWYMTGIIVASIRITRELTGSQTV